MYERTNWVNDNAPALSAENLNKMEDGIYSANEQADENKVEVNKLKTSKINYTEIKGSGGDINAGMYLNPGVYQFKGAKTIQNVPQNEKLSDYIQGALTVFNEQIDVAEQWSIVQVWYGIHGIYHRRYTYNERFHSGSWSDWEKFVTETDLPSVATTDKVGLVKMGSGVSADEDGKIKGNIYGYDTFKAMSANNLISKGTLNNVLNEVVTDIVNGILEKK